MASTFELIPHPVEPYDLYVAAAVQGYLTQYPDTLDAEDRRQWLVDAANHMAQQMLRARAKRPT